MGKLDTTGNLLELFQHAQGINEVPPQYYTWAMLSTVAATVADRVWFEQRPGWKLTPNLYVMLVGPSATGKGIAIDAATKLLTGVPRVRTYRGQITAPALIDALAAPPRRGPHGKRMYESRQVFFITPELSLSLGNPQQADGLIKLMTELYTGGDYEYNHSTRYKGNVRFSHHNVNWLGGSVDDWFVECLSPASIQGGAMGRMCIIPASYNPELRVPEPMVPGDYEEVMSHICTRLLSLSYVEGAFEKSEESRALWRQWYLERDPAGDVMMMPTWKRQPDLLLKLEMVLALCDGGDLYISRDHTVKARRLSYAAQDAVPALVTLSNAPDDMRNFSRVRDLLKNAGRIQQSALTRRCYKWGVNARRLRTYLETLMLSGEVEREMRGHASYFTWHGQRSKTLAQVLRMAPSTKEGDET